MIVAIDTTHDVGSVALIDQGVVIDERSLASTDGFAHKVFFELEVMLREHEVDWSDLDALAAANGPGSFTGVRVGLTAVKGLAEAAGKPVFGVSKLEALQRFGKSEKAAAFYDARRGEVFAREADGVEIAAKFADWVGTIAEDVELVSFDFAGYDAGGHVATLAPREIAGKVGLIAWERYVAGERPDPAVLDANYLRRSDAEVNWKQL